MTSHTQEKIEFHGPRSRGSRRGFNRVLAYYRETMPLRSRRQCSGDRTRIAGYFGRCAGLNDRVRDAIDGLARTAYQALKLSPLGNKSTVVEKPVHYQMCPICETGTPHEEGACTNWHRERYCSTCCKVTFFRGNGTCSNPSHGKTYQAWCMNCVSHREFAIDTEICQTCKRRRSNG